MQKSLSTQRFLRGLLVATTSFGLLAASACATTNPPAVSQAPLRTNATTYLLKVHGTLTEVDGRTVARIDPFQTPYQPRSGAPVELYLSAFPAQEFDAVLSDVANNDPFTLRADADLVHPDPRLAPGASFTAQIIVVASTDHRDPPADEATSQAPASLGRLPAGDLPAGASSAALSE